MTLKNPDTDGKKRLAIFPYNKQAAPLVRHGKMIRKYGISALASLKGWGLSGKDAGFADNGPDTGIVVKPDIVDVLEECDALFIPDYDQNTDFDRFVYPKVLAAIDAGKEIVCGAVLSEERKKDLRQRCEEKGTTFTYAGNRTAGDFTAGMFVPENSERQKLLRINTPVVTVLGITHNTNKSEVQLSLMEDFIERGYKVTCISTRPYADLFGGISLPDFLFHNEVSEAQKIVMFNGFVKTVEETEKPDVILLGVPGGIMPVSDTITNGFGILAYEMCMAVEPDVSVLCMLYERYKREYFEHLVRSVRYRLGTEINGFVIANGRIDWGQSENKEKAVFSYMESHVIDESIGGFSDWGFPLFNIFNRTSRSGLCDTVLSTLTEFAEIASV